MKTHLHNSRSGFTILELMVVVAIIGILSSVFIFNHSNFREQLTLTSDVQELESTLRLAQANALAVKQPPGVESDDEVQYGYGVHFSGDNRTYRLYYFERGEEENKLYDVPDDDRLIREVQLRDQNVISHIEHNEDGYSPGHIVVTFERPRPDAEVIWYRTADPEYFEYIEVTITSPSGLYCRAVMVTGVGQISTEEVDSCD